MSTEFSSQQEGSSHFESNLELSPVYDGKLRLPNAAKWSLRLSEGSLSWLGSAIGVALGMALFWLAGRNSQLKPVFNARTISGAIRL
jgi:hypothetical protein